MDPNSFIVVEEDLSHGTVFRMAHPLLKGAACVVAFSLMRFLACAVPKAKSKKVKESNPEAKETIFAVKVQTSELNTDPNQCLAVYNKHRDIDFQTKSCPALYHLVMQNGMLGKSGWTAKKVFLKAQLLPSEAEGGAGGRVVRRLKLLTSMLAPFEEW